MVKLGDGKEVCPFLRVVGAEEAEVHFKLLIGLLSMSINLRVIGSKDLDHSGEVRLVP